MPRPHGFYSSEHEQAFLKGNHLIRRGGDQAPVCGALTRTGAACQNLPIREGKGRCLRHAGPKAANEHHRRIQSDFLLGKISAIQLKRSEERRATNRLGTVWKRNPWLPGVTIKLGEDESRLRQEVQSRGLNMEDMAPAVNDWLRWKFRRHQIDRRDSSTWTRVLCEELPKRIAAAGACPVNYENVKKTDQTVRSYNYAPTTTSAGVSSKRQLPDKPRAPKVPRGKGYLRPGRPTTIPPKELEMDELMALYRENLTVVGPLLKACQSESDRLNVLRALQAVVSKPNDMGARGRWMSIIRALEAA